MITSLLLSGGGFRGVAHIGAIKALEEYGIYPSHIAGRSAVALGSRYWTFLKQHKFSVSLTMRKVPLDLLVLKNSTTT
ncbi:MAG: hypothetical protein ACI9SG_001005 [Maribacter sp.]|jgi:hypothetical protein